MPRLLASLALAIVTSLSSCRGLGSSGLQDMVESAVERALPALQKHHEDAGRPLPAMWASVELLDPKGRVHPRVRATYLEHLEELLRKPRYSRRIALQPNQFVFEAIKKVSPTPLTPGEAWVQLADPAFRERLREPFAESGTVVDYYVRGTLGYDKTHWTLALELRDAEDWSVINAIGRYVR